MNQTQIAYADYGCDAQSSEARGCPGKDAFQPRAKNSTYEMLNQILVSRSSGFTAPTNIDAAGAENAGLIQQNYIQVNPNMASSFLVNAAPEEEVPEKAPVVDDFTTCNCNGPYMKMADGCGCDCNPYGWDWNHPTGGCMKGNFLGIILLLLVLGVVFYYCMKK